MENPDRRGLVPRQSATAMSEPVRGLALVITVTSRGGARQTDAGKVTRCEIATTPRRDDAHVEEPQIDYTQAAIDRSSLRSRGGKPPAVPVAVRVPAPGLCMSSPADPHLDRQWRG